MRDYSAARSFFGFVLFLGWAAVALGGLIAFSGLTGSASMRGGFGSLMALAAVPYGLSLLLIGLLVVVLAQVGRAGIDTAENTGELLAVSKEQLQLFKELMAAPAARTATPTKCVNSPAHKPTVTRSDASYKAPAEQQFGPIAGPVPHAHYKGIAIQKDGERYIVADKAFPSPISARDHIDSLKPSERRALVPLVVDEARTGMGPLARDGRLR